MQLAKAMAKEEGLMVSDSSSYEYQCHVLTWYRPDLLNRLESPLVRLWMQLYK